jgi:hypothetical protein
MLPSTLDAQRAQGADMSRWSLEQRRIWFEQH